MSDAGSRPSPYVGPRSLRTGERLYGRDREIARLFNLLLAERIVLLYSPSGAGKSSLLHAGLIPRLREEGFFVHPSVRVGIEPPKEAPAGVNRHVLSALLSLEDDGGDDRDLDLTRVAGQTLAGYLERRRAAAPDRRGDETAEVLLIDQFEEILTIAPTAIESKQAFFAQLGAALRDERLWLIVAMREDFIAGLDTYRSAVPTALRTTFRLDLLGREAALAAIQGPAAAAGVKFLDVAADKLVSDLRQVRVQRIDGSVETQLGPHVEPVQVQVVCQSLWNQLRADERAIGLDHLARVGDVDAALATYYDAQVEAAAGKSGVPERVLRQWIGRHLVTQSGLRTQVLQTPARTLELDNAALVALVDAHLLRTDTRRGMTWFELAHDRIVRPLQESNARWFSAKLSPVQRQAELWDSRERPEGLLLASLEEAERLLAVDEERSDVERAFLGQSVQVRAREAAARRNLKLLRVLTAVVALLVLSGLIIGIVVIRRAGARALEVANALAQAAETRRQAAEEQQQAAEAELTHQLIGQVALYRDQQPELAALLGVAASSRLGDAWQRKAALINIGATAPHLVARLSTGGSDPASGSGASYPWKVAAAGGRLFAVDRRGQVWRLTIADRGAVPLLPAGLRATDVAGHPTDSLLAIGGSGRTITLWDDATGAARGAFELPDDAGARDDREWVEGLAFSADGRSLLAVRKGEQRPGVGFVVDVATGSARELGVMRPRMSEAPDVGLSADGTIAVMSPKETDGTIFVFAGAPFERTVRKPACGGDCPMHVGRFSPSGSHLVTGGEGALALWDIVDGTVGETARLVRLGGGAVVRDILYMRSGKIAVLTDDRISLWSDPELKPWGTPIELTAGRPHALGEAGAQGEWIVAAFATDAPVHVFDPGRLAPRGLDWPAQPAVSDMPEFPFKHSPVLVALDPSGTTVAATDYDGITREGRVALLDMAGQTREVLTTPVGAQFASMLFTGDGKRLVVADARGKITAWDLAGKTSRMLGTMPAQNRQIALAVDEAGQILAGAREGDGLHLGSEADGFATHRRIGERVPSMIGFDRGARRVAIAGCVEETRPRMCSQSHIDIHDVAAPAALVRRLVVDFEVAHVVFSADGRRLAAADAQHIRVWDLAEGAPIALTVRRDLGLVNAIDLSADGRILVASAVNHNASVDIALWDLTSGEELAPPLRAHNPAIGGTPEGRIVLSADGRLIVSGTCDGVVLWDIDDAAMRRRACALAGRELTPAEQARFLGRRRPYEALCPGGG